MSLATAIYARAQADATLAALIGGATAPRIYPVQAPQAATAPYVVWQGIGSLPDNTHSEASSATERMVQFACFAATQREALALREALVAAFDGVDLANGDNGTLDDDNRDDFDEPANLYRADADFTF